MEKSGPAVPRRRSRAAICAGILLLLAAALIFNFVFILPGIRAKDRMKEIREALASGAVGYFVVTDFNYAGEFLPGEREVRVGGERADEFSERVLSALESAKYTGGKKSLGGNWDTRVRMYYAGGFYDLYAGDAAVYLPRGERNYYFRLGEGESTALGDMIWYN